MSIILLIFMSDASFLYMSNVEIKSSASYFVTSIKGRYFRLIMDERGA